ncbi:C4-dicarboxylate TRAP transporter large permease protein DctM [bioreactor metagenome]|uniref:C4-dicarboxylate TRAP transporter large permease protein DctM n=1 Tax=bioreactor metagenome TaxID=1076179 RepID=A0A645E5J2_9ZZZZ
MVYASITGVSVGDMFMGGILPGIMMGLALIIIIMIEARRKGLSASRERASWGQRLKSFRTAFWGFLMPVIILGGIYGGIFTPTEAAAVSVVYGLIVGLFIYREVKLKDLYDLLVDSGKTTGGIMLIIGAATLFSYICTVHGISGAAQTLLLNISGNKYVFLLIVNVIFLIAGCFVDANSAMYIFIPIMYPVAKKLGIDPIHFGVLSTVNLAIGQVTPPVGVNLFVAIGVSSKLQGLRDKTTVTIETISKAVWPMILACIVTLMLVTYVPFFSTVFLPG